MGAISKSDAPAGFRHKLKVVEFCDGIDTP
jgi:hypothetical protein